MNAFNKNLALWIVIVLMMIMLYNIFNTQQQQTEQEVNYTSFLGMVEDGSINSVVIEGQKLTATDSRGEQFVSYTPQDNELIKILRSNGVSIEAKPKEETPWFVSVLVSWFPMILLIAVWIFFMRQMQGGGGKAMSFGKSGARMLSEQGAKITFADVAGVDEAKEEVAELVEFLRNPKKYTRLGGRIPKGVLMVGAPGTGKTLLARAIAGEAGVPFFSISGSDFVEMFVGVGASRVRDLFVQGKKNAPCLIFIDELDAVGRQRGAGLGGGHDEREQTLNQLLVEMDGFESNEGVILIASTNRPDVLDPALLRPGRFDRQVVVPMPDIKGRTEIIQVHLKPSPTDSDVDPVVLAKGTPGFSGADLENMVNEAALIAAKKNKEKINMADFEEAKDKIFMGLERKSKVMKEEDKRITAYHEGGHALVARFSPDTDSINKITIIPRGRAAGITWFLPEERDFMFRDQLMSELAVAMGGRASEEIVFNRVSTGGANDIKKATELATKMICSWGMSESLGPLTYGKSEDHIFLGREIAQHRDYSEATAQKIDAEVSALVMESYNNAKQILTDNRDILNRLAEILIDKETVMGKELDDLIHEMRPGIRLPSDPSDKEAQKAGENSTQGEPATPPADEEETRDSEASTDEAL
ncbi:MAG: ATP-dependent zinc metalloprotease FtsH [Desulfosalsimonas sp.]